jgi:hypothetical protein
VLSIAVLNIKHSAANVSLTPTISINPLLQSIPSFNNHLPPPGRSGRLRRARNMGAAVATSEYGFCPRVRQAESLSAYASVTTLAGSVFDTSSSPVLRANAADGM